jgi:hypothetical protein
MTGKYTSDEFQSSVDKVSPKLEGVVRGAEQSADDIVDSIKDYIYRSINSDIDSVYAIIYLLRNKEIIACTEALGSLSDMLELLPSALSEPTSANTAAAEEMADLIEELEFAPGGLRSELVSRIQALAQVMAQNNKTPSGKIATGTSKESARSGIRALASNLSVLIESIKINGDGFLEAIRSYMLADFESVSASHQARKAYNAVEGHIHEGADAQQLMLDAAVSASMVKQASEPKRDITRPKYEGPVITLPGVAAELYGGTDPLILQDSDPNTAEFLVDGSEYASLVAPPSEGPVYLKKWPASLNMSSDFGVWYEFGGDTNNVFISGNSVKTGKFLKYIVRGTTLSGTFYQKNPTLGQPPILHQIIDKPNGGYPYGGGVVRAKEVGNPNAQWFDFGHIDYAAGVMELNSNFSGTGNGLLYFEGGTSVTIGYDYYPLGDLVFRSGMWIVSANPTITPTYNRDIENYFGTLGFITHNRAGWLELEAGWLITSFGDFVGAYQGGSAIESLTDEYALTNLDSSIVGPETMRFALNRNGTAHRLTFPDKPSLDDGELRTDPLGDTFTDTPSLNRLLKLTYEDVGNVYGADTPGSSVSLTGPIDLDIPQLTLSPGGVSVFETTTSGVPTHTDTLDIDGNVTTNGYFEVDTEGLEVGDDVYDSVTQAHAKIVAIAPDTETMHTTQQNGVSIFPAFARAPGSGNWGLEEFSTHSVSFSRHRLRVTSQTDEASSSVATETEALGFSDATLGSSLAIALGLSTDLDNVITDPGYNIKPGDIILEKTLGASRPIGRVESVNGNKITLVIVPEGVSHDYPFTSLVIVALGWQRHVKISSELRKYLNLLEKISSNELVNLANAVTNSGTGQGQFTSLIANAVSAISSIRDMYLLYDAHTVNTTSSLMDFIRQEKLTVVHDLLATAQFSEIPDLTPEKISTKGDVESMLGVAADLIGGTAQFVEITRGYDPLNDFTQRSKESNIELKDLPDVDFIP